MFQNAEWYWNRAVQWMGSEDAFYWALSFLVAAVGFATITVGIMWWYRDKKALRGKIVSNRKLLLAQMMSDVITDGIEKLYAEDKITIKEKKRLYSFYAKKYDLQDLVRPKKKLGEGLCNWRKEQSRKRIVTNRVIANGGAVPIPGDPPPTISERKKGRFLKNRTAL